MKKIYLFLFLCFFITQAFSQYNYLAANAVAAAGIYTDIGTAGLAIATNFNGGTLTFDEDTSSVQNIGFNFLYNGATFTQFVLSTNGFIKLGATAATISTNVASNSYTTPNIIAPFNLDLDGATSPEYRVATTGTAGSRVCTVQFKNLRDWNLTAGAGQYSSINFQIKLYEGLNNIEFIYGTFSIGTGADAFIQGTAGIRGNNSIAAVNITKTSAQAWATATFLNGDYIANRFNSRKSALPTSGQTYRFVAVLLPPNDAQVQLVYTNEKLPVGIFHAVRALVNNAGSNTLTNLQVTLNITGAGSPFSNSQSIASLAPGATRVVTFATYNPQTAGTNAITVSVPADGNNANNLATTSQAITINTFGYGNTAVPTGEGGVGVGINGNTFDVALRFSTSNANTINQVTTYFNQGGNPYTIAIFNAAGTGGLPGTAIFTSASQTSVAGANALALSPAVSVPAGDFFLIIKQTGTTSFAYAFETENPIRSGSFYLTVPGGNTTWTDFAPTENFKFIADVRFGSLLPVKLTTFTGNISGEDAILQWNTSTEVNNIGFDIQKSENGYHFTTIGFVAGAGTSTNVNKYSFTDRSITAGNIFYRLRQIDKDGKFEYSNVIRLKKSEQVAFAAKVINPARDKVLLQVTSPTAEKITLNLFTVSGQLLFTRSTEITAGSTTLSIGNSLSKGAYFVSVVSKGVVTTYKVIVD